MRWASSNSALPPVVALGLEDFYGRLGWAEIGRWPDALRLAPGDDRDEILMILRPL